MPQFLLKMPSTSSWSQLPFYTATRNLNNRVIEEREGSTYRLLPAHDEVTSTSNHLLVRVTSVHESQNRPGGLHYLGHFMLRVDVGYARLGTKRN